MTARNAIVLINGSLRELPAGDTLNGATASGVAGNGMVSEYVDVGATLTIPTRTQLAVHGAYEIAGRLNIDGKLVLP